MKRLTKQRVSNIIKILVRLIGIWLIVGIYALAFIVRLNNYIHRSSVGCIPGLNALPVTATFSGNAKGSNQEQLEKEIGAIRHLKPFRLLL